MQIPTDMHKWRTKFAWQMLGFALLLMSVGVGIGYGIWLSRSKWLVNPAKLLVPTAEMAFAAALTVGMAILCLSLSIRTWKQDARIKEMEKNRPPLTLSKLREELQPEKLEQSRASMLRTLQAIPPEARVYAEANMKQLVDRYRADLGSTPEVEAELAKLEALIADVLNLRAMP